MRREEIELYDIQGLVIRGFIEQLPYGFYLLLHIDDGASARRWLQQVLTRVTNCKDEPKDCALNIAFTHSGMKGLGVDEAALQTFPTPFIEGMSDRLRARVLGDEPAEWEWGNNTGKSEDILLIVFASTEAKLKDERAAIVEMCRLRGVTPLRFLETIKQTECEHFGFRDGISQPVMRGDKGGKEKKATNEPGEFVLGYPDDYGYTNYNPLVSEQSDTRSLLRQPKKQDIKRGAEISKRMLGMNGTYLVFRQLEQHVAQFWNFVRTAAIANGEPTERFAAKLIGRWRSGAPLVTCSETDNPESIERNELSLNKFNYFKPDSHGLLCPVGAHIRRANPRDSLGPQKSFAIRSANHHRILRRGRSYGARVNDKFIDDGVSRGLYFICINSDIERQFEFVQQSWINNTVFGGLYSEVDPISHIGKDRVLTLPTDPLRRQINRLE